MPEFFLELFSEEIPARMQAQAGFVLSAICVESLSFINFKPQKTWTGPRHLAISGTVDGSNGGGGIEEVKGPRAGAPDAALDGFAKKHGVARDELVLRDGVYFLEKRVPTLSARDVILGELSSALTKFSWPKSMRWGQGGDFTWVRPLRRIILLLDGEVVPITLGPLTAANETEGHRVLGSGVFTVSSAEDWAQKLRANYVIADQDERRKIIADGIAAKAAELGLSVAEDSGLLDEVTGLVEWPVPLIGKIDGQFMDLPPEVRELSMKINQKYFALRDAVGKPAPYFAFVANLEAPDGGAAIIAGNERVLRARLSDARHFWDVDLKTPLDALLPKLEKITFHAKIGTQRQRADRIANLAREIALKLGAEGFQAKQAEWAALLCKADLVTGMVGEFPELQGVMGGYYAEQNPNGWDGAAVGQAIKTHYQPKGPTDFVPEGIVSISLALADKIDTLVQFFRINEKPTGSGDPYALRRAALGVIRIILENGLRLPLKTLIQYDESLFEFIVERLRVLLRSAGERFDILNAVFAAGQDDDLERLLVKANALNAILNIDDGSNLLISYRRAANILKIAESESGRINGQPDANLFVEQQEHHLFEALHEVAPVIEQCLITEDYPLAMIRLAQLRPVVDAFFENVTVNTEPPELRRNRLQLLNLFRDTVHQIADFSKIEG
jgi:glycyl-tRNA synthetase beta chain